MKKMQKKDVKPDQSSSSRKSNKEHEKKVAPSDETKGILSKINGKARKE